MKTKLATIICSMLLFTSCWNKSEKKPLFVDFATLDETQEYVSGSIIRVPFTESNGVKWIQDVEINGIYFDMIFDTGSSTTSISLAEATYLLKRKKLVEEDFQGKNRLSLADGSIVEGMVVNLKKVCIGGLCFDNVGATVMQNMESPLILGNSVLDRLATYKIDNDNKEIIFEIK